MTTQQIASWTIPVLVFSVATLVALLARQISLAFVAKRAEQFNFPSVLLDALRFPTILWCIAFALAVAIHNADVPPAVEAWVHKAIGAFLIISMTIVAAAVAVRMATVYGERNRFPFAVAGLTRALIHIFVFSVGLLVLLSQLGVQVAPILTALGVGGLAVALALRDTLANLFAGIHILVEQPIAVGDYIELNDREKGTVRDIGWRTTRLATGSGAMLVIPNEKITSGILTNYSARAPISNAEVMIVAGHEADPDRIAAIAIEAAGRVEGVLPEPAPVVMFDPGVLPTHIAMKLIVHVSTVHQRGPVQSKLRKQIFEAFRRESIPFPAVRPV